MDTNGREYLILGGWDIGPLLDVVDSSAPSADFNIPPNSVLSVSLW